MRRILRGAAVLFVLALAALAVFAIPTIWGRPWSIEHFYTRVFAETLWEHPMLLSQLRVLEPYGIRWHDDELDDFSVAFAEREAERVRKNLRTLREYPLDEQSEEQRFSTRVLAWYLQVLADGAEFQFHPFPLNQFDGIQTTIPDFLLNVHQIRDARGARDYVTRLEKTGVAIDQVIAAMRFRMERGIVPPRVIVERVGADVERFLAGGPEASPLLTHFGEQVAKLDAVSDQERGQLLGAARRAVGEVVWPAWERLRGFVPELAAKAHEEVGAWALPEGSLYYGWALRYHTTTNLGADAIHELGLREVERIHGEMRAILAAEGFAVAEVATEAVAPPPAFTEAAPAGGEPAAPAPAPDPAAQAAPAPAPAVVPSLGDVLRAVQANPPVRYGDDEAGRQRILADYQAIVDEAQRRLPELVTRLPRAPVRVERVPAFKESGAAGAYYMPAPLDGSKPGVFYANLRSPAEVVPFSMRTLAYHEAIPGHHLQIALAQEMGGVPFFRRVIPFTAFIEGWALYAERIAGEAGWHPTPMDRLGQLVAEVFRAARLVVDAGLHARRWTREQAIDYMLRNTGMPETEVEAEVERYIVLPGQATAYKVGQMKILELRERAREALGPRFDAKAFNDLVLSRGALPLELLEEVVGEWLVRQPTSDRP
ncbi:MAG: DUF885 domain-containing protein [Deltaproteobacteria bacterium]|nr:DUF885 domain-containing protein [Deltaproteobacteria bacterium]